MSGAHLPRGQSFPHETSYLGPQAEANYVQVGQRHGPPSGQPFDEAGDLRPDYSGVSNRCHVPWQASQLGPVHQNHVVLPSSQID